MRNGFLLLVSIMTFASINGWAVVAQKHSVLSGRVARTDTMTFAVDMGGRNLTTYEILLKTSEIIRTNFEYGDMTFHLFETFFRQFLDHYEKCKTEDGNIIRKIKNKESSSVVILDYPFYDATDGCNVRDVDLVYNVDKSKAKKDVVDFVFKNDYNFIMRTLIDLYISTKNYKDVIPLSTQIFITVKNETMMTVKVSTEAFDNISDEQMIPHNRKVLKIVKGLIEKQIVPQF
ncbi:MAG: hypothetical protein JNM93_07750 [Bacteriovoracaceae bacterium]|nr:hypothetical protein [Bacteriovoracaceae bacterium]